MDQAKIKAKHEEELKDAESYEAMAEECPEWRSIFCDMAKEEREHAEALHHILEHS